MADLVIVFVTVEARTDVAILESVWHGQEVLGESFWEQRRKTEKTERRKEVRG